jgi:predicted anti-sigma-YlaC factor YlaD
MLHCNQVSRALSDALDGKLPRYQLALIRFHLSFCRSCRALSDSLAYTQSMLRALADETDLGLDHALDRALDQALDEKKT